MKGFLAENRACSESDVYQLTSDTREEMTCLFHIFSQHSLQTLSSISFLVSSALMKLTAFITKAKSEWWALNAALETFKNKDCPLG